MKYTKKIDERASLGIYLSTKEKFDNLVGRLNRRNRDELGDKASKITRDDVLLELVNAYELRMDKQE